MATNASIPLMYVQSYERTVRFLAQQSITRLRPWVAETAVNSATHGWERIQKSEAILKDSRDADTPEILNTFSRRLSTAITMHTGDTVEQEDIVQTLIDPNSAIATSQGYSMRRAIDTEIISAASSATAANGSGSADAMDPNQIIGVTGTPVPFTFDLVTQVSEIFMENDVDPDEPKVFVLSPAQARKLLQLTEATSGDYNAMKPLTAKGYVESWMGYTWVVSTLLQDPAGDGSESLCFAMTRKAIGLQMNRDTWVRIAEDPTKSFMWRLYCAGTYGAVRVEDKQIVQIVAANAI
jgi:hypothetical protein